MRSRFRFGVADSNPRGGGNIHIGSIAGPNGCVVKLQDARKKPWPDISSIPPKETITEGVSATTMV